MALKQAAQDEAKRQWQLEYDLAKKKSSVSSSGNRSYSSGGGSTTPQFNNKQTQTQTTNTPKSSAAAVNILESALNPLRNIFGGNSSPNLKEAGRMGNQTVYTDGSKYYLKDGSTLIDVTNQYRGTISKSTSGGGSGGFGGGITGSR